MTFLFTIFYLNEYVFEPLGICRFIEMFQYFMQYFIQNPPKIWNFGRYKQFVQEYCLHENIPPLSTDIYSKSWVGFLKEFIDENHMMDNQKQTAISLNTERFIRAKRILEVSINQVSLTYIVM